MNACAVNRGDGSRGNDANVGKANERGLSRRQIKRDGAGGAAHRQLVGLGLHLRNGEGKERKQGEVSGSDADHGSEGLAIAAAKYAIGTFDLTHRHSPKPVRQQFRHFAALMATKNRKERVNRLTKKARGGMAAVPRWGG
jgi:hypothetical protein